MKKVVLTAMLAGSMLTAMAQSTYIVKTKNVRKPVTTTTTAKPAATAEAAEEEEPQDFISQNFRFRSLCDWQDGMRFMVMPEKIDLLVNTFCDAATGREVSSGKLRYKIMVYKNHTETSDNHSRINFICEDDGQAYYYQIPSGSFEDYCYGKLGVPTLAYLGDVDIAREKLMGAHLFTKGGVYRIDTQYDGDGFEEVTIPNNTEVIVKSIGVGTRSYPVKIIVEDPKTGREFYQCMALSRTNSGMRDDEFAMDKKKFLFTGSFEMIDATVAVSGNYADYIGKHVYTKYATNMITKGDGRERTLKVPRLTEFKITAINPHSNSNYVTMTLTETESQRVYLKDVTFVNESVVGDIDGMKEDYFGYLFGIGEGILRNTTTATRAMIRQGRVGAGMTEDEVLLALGEPDNTAQSNNGRYDWIYKRSQGKILIVQFGKTGKVIGTKVQR